MALVFTVFFCGTGSNSFDRHNPNYPSGEVVSTLASNQAGTEFADWAQVDGPGSGNLQEDEKWVEPGNYLDARGKLQGMGWEENVAHAVAVIKGDPQWERKLLTDKQYAVLKEANVPIADRTVNKGYIYNTYENPERRITQQQLQFAKARMFRKGEAVTAINAIGWSRGGVSCIMLANALAQDPATRNIPVRIFAVDPVPGLGNFQAHRCSLPSNVVEYVGLYARDECSKGFAPIVPAFPEMERAPVVMPFPGRHATLPGNGATDGEEADQDPDFLSVGKLVRHLAESCLTRWGARLNDRLELSDEQVHDEIRTMVGCDARLSALKNKSYTYLRDMTGSDRTVGWGPKGAGSAFSEVQSDGFANSAGLSMRIGDPRWEAAYLRACRG